MAEFCHKTDYQYPLYLAISYLVTGFLTYDKEYLQEVIK